MPKNINSKNNNILVIGLGLIGSSLCRALKNSSYSEKICGYDHDKEVMEYAVEHNFVDESIKDLKSGIKEADLVIICVPVHQVKKILDISKDFFNTKKVFTDTLSVKNPILDFLAKNNLSNIDNLIFSHPMAGTEHSGIINSKEDLFLNATTIINPLCNSSLECINIVTELWKAINCNIVEFDASNHDSLLAAISHAPHFISFVLSKKMNDLEFSDIDFLPTKTPSLLDMTRIANSDPEAWASIFLENENALCNFIDEYIKELSELKYKIKSNNFDDIFSYLKKSKPIK
ncbi:MAG: prephenate dehydrogenase/arogenate dehydrogenase family protein [Gammaproteobacteria bacterium]|jgi:cyclohexadieny/prephenate dehydrogenase|nr:prephenate dehydrogenase/arogenate dehydrogenase family protein [Gammaproteobacteria bacterium]MBT7603166.1 prephenate dehydrogenase/arogenate dehydrogenase family protein [Gammaproteobacteria bacterium]